MPASAFGGTPRLIVRGVSIFIWGIAVAAPTLAEAQAPKTLAILPSVVIGPHGRLERVQVFDAILAAAQGRLGLRALSYNRVVLEGSQSLASSVAQCGSDEACIQRNLRLAHVDLGLRVIVSFALNPPLVTMRLLDTQKQDQSGVQAFELKPETSLKAPITAQAQALLEDAGYPLGARLVVQVNPADATVIVNNGAAQPEPGASQSYVLAAGIYPVRATKSGFLPAETTVQLTEGQQTQTTLTLTPASSPNVWSTWWFWTAVGVVAAGTAAAVVVATDPFGGSNPGGCLCITTEGTPCTTCP